MAIRIIDDSKLNDIAVAIQAKDSGGQMTVDDMPDRIDALPTGEILIPKTITENGIYNASSDNADGYDVVTVGVPQDPNEQLVIVNVHIFPLNIEIQIILFQIVFKGLGKKHIRVGPLLIQIMLKI